MNYINKQINYHDGTRSIISITSEDNYHVNLNKNYVIANKDIKTNKFKNSILGSDIGIGSKGFVSVAALATIISIIAFVTMIISFRV